jgi:hypothetical protein
VDLPEQCKICDTFCQCAVPLKYVGQISKSLDSSLQIIHTLKLVSFNSHDTHKSGILYHTAIKLHVLGHPSPTYTAQYSRIRHLNIQYIFKICTVNHMLQTKWKISHNNLNGMKLNCRTCMGDSGKTHGYKRCQSGTHSQDPYCHGYLECRFLAALLICHQPINYCKK